MNLHQNRLRGPAPAYFRRAVPFCCSLEVLGEGRDYK